MPKDARVLSGVSRGGQCEVGVGVHTVDRIFEGEWMFDGQRFVAPLHDDLAMMTRGPAAPGAPVETPEASPEQDSLGLVLPSFTSIYAQYFAFVWSSARRLGVKRDAMDDVVQEIFMVIYRKLDSLRQPQSLRSWIYGIARRTVSGYHRSRRSHDVSDPALAHQVSTQPDALPTPLELAEQNEEAKVLWELLGEIDPPKREVLVLVEIEGMTAPEVAEALEIPLNTAYSRLRAGRIAFEAALARRTLRGESSEGE
jgi:RNA polymerase sigma-70 factor (ECF subfamily)